MPATSSKFDVAAGTLLEDFENVADWTITTGTAVNDTTVVQTGSKSLKLTSGVGTHCYATKTISADLASAGRVELWVYIPVLADVASVQVILSNDSGFTNFYSRSPATLHEGWNSLLLGRSQWGVTGSPSWHATFVRLRVRVNANASATAVAYFDALRYGGASRPKAIVSADDGWATQHTEMFAYMRRYGFRGSLYLIKQRINTAGYLTTAQIQEMYDAGWDVLNHTDNHVNLRDDLTTQAEVEAELGACRDWIVANGWSRRRGELHVAYPQGGYDTSKVLPAMTALGMVTGRTTVNRTQAHVIDHHQLLTRQAHAYTASQATYRGYVDKAIEDGGCVQLNYHKIEANGTSDADTECDQSQFRDMIDYLDAKRAHIDVITFLDWYEGLTAARRPI